jgi:ATP-dependent DNA helicase RecG
MIELCREAGLPEPRFEQREGFFVSTIWLDWLTPEVLAGFNLNERQMKAVAQIQGSGRITNSEFQELTDCARKTAARDLDDLVHKSVIVRVGEKRGSYYIFTGKK